MPPSRVMMVALSRCQGRPVRLGTVCGQRRLSARADVALMPLSARIRRVLAPAERARRAL